MRKFGLLAVVAGALLVPAGVANADTRVACTFDGVTGNLTPPVYSIERDLADGNLADFEPGTFQFNGGVTCSGNDNGTPRAAVSGTVTASGTYSNQICGTGTADGTSTVTLNGVPNGVVDASFHIDFRGGAGVITITSASRRNTSETGTGNGFAQLAPATGSCANGPGVSQFRVVGGFAANLA